MNSCEQQKAESTGYSEAFKPVFNKTTAFFETNRAEQGLHYLDSSMNQMAHSNTDDKFRAYGFHFIYWKNTKHNYEKALLYADSMLMTAKKGVAQKQYVSNVVEANMAMGDANFLMQRFNNAYQNYFEGFRLGKNNLDNGALSDYSYRMGMILYKMGHYKLAATYFKESFRLNPMMGDQFTDFYRQQEVLDNTALSYKHNNELDSAVFYFDKTIRYIDHFAPRFKKNLQMLEMAKGVVYGNKAEVLIATGDTISAIGLLKKSIAINLEKGGDNSDAESAEIKLAQLYSDKKDSDKLLGLLTTLRGQLDTIKNEDAEIDWNRLMSSYYSEKKSFKKSLAYLQVYNTLKDSNVKKLDLLKESNVNQQLANFEKQYQINNLKDHNKLQLYYLYAAIACTAMALVIILLVVRNWRRSKKDVEVVNALNRQVNLQKINLEQALDELKSSDLEKDRILRTVAHDLRNPIGGIASLTMVMEDDDFTDEQREMINLIKETSNNSLELINEILEVTNNGPTGLKKELVEINSLLSKSVDLLRFKAAEKNQQIKLELLEEPEELLISREKIWRVMGNLISNAIKFSPYGEVIHVAASETESYVEISVKDSGIGVPADLKDKIFNMFSEAKRPGTAGEKSFGLGLSISKQIIESHGGKIWVESNAGKGSTFYIRLPKPKAGKPNPPKNRRTTARMT